MAAHTPLALASAVRLSGSCAPILSRWRVPLTLALSRKGRGNRRALAASLSFASPAKGDGIGGLSLLRYPLLLPQREREPEGSHCFVVFRLSPCGRGRSKGG